MRKKVPVQVGDGGGSFHCSFRCSSTFCSASCETQPCTALYRALSSSRGVRMCCFAWLDRNSESWLFNASRIAFHASKRSNVDLRRYDLRSAWIPLTREVATFPK